VVSFKVRYIGVDRADIRVGEIYDAEESKVMRDMYAVKDRSEDWFLYPISWFVKLDEEDV
jgi:hypothetical protein